MGVSFDSLVFYCMYCTIRCPEGEGKIQWLLNCCELKETLLWLLLYLFIYFLCTSWNGLNLFFCFTRFYRVSAQSAPPSPSPSPVYFCLRTTFRSSSRCFYNLNESAHLSRMKHYKKKNKNHNKKIKSSANPFYFSLIWETIFCMNINTMADILACAKKKKKRSNLKREKKKNVPFLLYLYISKYLLKYVILLILLTIKGFLNKKSLYLFLNIVKVVGVESSAFCYSTQGSV